MKLLRFLISGRCHVVLVVLFVVVFILYVIFIALGNRRGWHIFVVGRSASPGQYNSNIFVEHTRNLDVGRRGQHIFVVSRSVSPG